MEHPYILFYQMSNRYMLSCTTAFFLGHTFAQGNANILRSKTQPQLLLSPVVKNSILTPDSFLMMMVVVLVVMMMMVVRMSMLTIVTMTMN